jgi:Holliday junction resolvase RusA-like endonuclease
MYTFLCEYPPRSVQAEKCPRYKSEIINSFKKYNSVFEIQSNYLYGIAYYFHNKPTQLDADNLSKPIWDALENILYDDDKIIKIRYAGVYYLKQPKSISLINLTNMPKHIYDDFIDKIDSVNHLLYVEIGYLNYSLYKFGAE